MPIVKQMNVKLAFLHSIILTLPLNFAFKTATFFKLIVEEEKIEFRAY